MAYAHVRCSSQHKLETSKLNPGYFSSKPFKELTKAIDFLTLKNPSGNCLAEIILCPNNHILRVSTKRQLSKIRCPRCDWKTELWLYKKDQIKYLIEMGIKDFDSGKISSALNYFREAQNIDKTNSTAYCLASRCLKKLGRHQDAIRELKKLLFICPEDTSAQNEMKSLLYKYFEVY
jgi:tetratricopeptide (TPR) repeat protein